MGVLRKFVVNGLWGSRRVHLDLHRDVNFLIGVNGTGKTTIVNLIAAALTADYGALERMPFQNLEIELMKQEKEKSPVRIEIQKRVHRSGRFIGVRYTFHEEGVSHSFNLSPLDDRLAWRNNALLARGEPIHPSGVGVQSVLERHVNVRWLSVHRTPSKSRTDDRGMESSVDRKLVQLNNDLIRFFSSLASQGAVQTTRFQKRVFLALIYTPAEDGQLMDLCKGLDLETEQQEFRRIFEAYGILTPKVSDQISNHFGIAQSAKNTKSYTVDQLAALLGVWPIHRVVQLWKDLENRQSAIYQPQEQFLSILNEMLRGKRIQLNGANELEAVLDNDIRIGLTALSSGEKQLVIILGEALLQEHAECLYIADEPELSLHVKWQESLTANIRRINPNAQMIFATHSPDVVSVFGDRVFDMERITS